MDKKVLGHIDCPSCGTVGGMRITHDKNGQPFGFCEAECDQQLRIGGSARRVRKFIERYPWAAPKQEAPAGPAPVAVTAPKRAPAPKPAPVTGTVTEEKAPKPAPVMSPFAAAVHLLGG